MNPAPAFRPLGNRYLVLPDESKAEETTVGEYTVSRDKDHHKKSSSGTVIARGKGCTELNVRDRISFGQYNGYAQSVEGVEYLILQESEILGELVATPFDPPDPSDLRLLERN